MVRVKPTNGKGGKHGGNDQLGGKKLYKDAPDKPKVSLA
jgi:hypothetical protein